MFVKEPTEENTEGARITMDGTLRLHTKSSFTQVVSLTFRLESRPIINHCLSGSETEATTVTVESKKVHNFLTGVDPAIPSSRNALLLLPQNIL